MSQAFSINCIGTSLLSFLFGLLIAYKRTRAPSRPLIWLWVGVCMAVAVWSFGLGMMTLSKSQHIANFWIRVHYTGANLIPIVFLHFILYFLGQQARQKRIIVIGYSISLIFEIMNMAGYLAIPVPKPPFLFYTSPGRFYNLYSLYFGICVIYAHFLLLKAWRVQNARRRQIQYLFLGSGIGFFGGSTAFLPVYNIQIFPFGMYLVALYVFIVGYAILYYQLLDISIIIRKTLIYSMVISALTLIYMAIVALFARVFEGLTGYQTVFSSAIAAGLITVGFQPLRKRIQGFVDEKFFRQYVDREEKLYELSREVITHTTSEAMVDSLMRVLGDTLHPKSAAIYLRSRDGDGFVLMSNKESSLPSQMPESNPLTDYFTDHPQPFVRQDVDDHIGASLDTRRPPRTEDAA
jgi:hypothetical protein